MERKRLCPLQYILWVEYGTFKCSCFLGRSTNKCHSMAAEGNLPLETWCQQFSHSSVPSFSQTGFAIQHPLDGTSEWLLFESSEQLTLLEWLTHGTFQHPSQQKHELLFVQPLSWKLFIYLFSHLQIRRQNRQEKEAPGSLRQVVPCAAALADPFMKQWGV